VSNGTNFDYSRIGSCSVFVCEVINSVDVPLHQQSVSELPQDLYLYAYSTGFCFLKIRSEYLE